MNDLVKKVYLNRRVPGWLYHVGQDVTTIREKRDAAGEEGVLSLRDD